VTDTITLSGVEYRSFEPDLEIRAGGDGRTVVGIAVPYNRVQQINHNLVEEFVHGAFAHQIRAFHRVPFARDHLGLGGTPIGKTIALREDASGLYGEWRVSATPTGDETLELLRDGVLRELSIGFREDKNRRTPEGVIQRTRAHLREVAVVMEGAYGDKAAVSAVRQAVEAGPSRLDQAQQLIARLPILPPITGFGG
jgi:Escherichia/Staphylococcus phage prohead protease